MDAISSSLGGMTRAVQRFERASADLVQGASGASNASPVNAVVETISAEAQFKASATTVRAAEQMYGMLLDILV